LQHHTPEFCHGHSTRSFIAYTLPCSSRAPAPAHLVIFAPSFPSRRVFLPPLHVTAVGAPILCTRLCISLRVPLCLLSSLATTTFYALSCTTRRCLFCLARSVATQRYVLILARTLLRAELGSEHACSAFVRVAQFNVKGYGPDRRRCTLMASVLFMLPSFFRAVLNLVRLTDVQPTSSLALIVPPIQPGRRRLCLAPLIGSIKA
jgi:hypothetical protein